MFRKRPGAAAAPGTSPFESQPTWQAAAAEAAGLSSSGRTTPDVSFDANPATGVSVYDSIPYPGAGRSQLVHRRRHERRAPHRGRA